MAREIIINDRNLGTRVAILVDREVEDLLFARDFSQQIVGNVYKGRVEDIVPGIQAAFVNIGREQNVFLPVNGVIPADKDKKIEHVLQPGQEVVIQIRKEATGTKGPKGSCKLELPGRYLIFLDEPGHIGVSRKLPGEERGRLRELAREIVPPDQGAILRTEAGDTKPELIKKEVNSLLALRNQIAAQAERIESPALVHHHSDLIDQVLRDRFTAEVDKLVIDTEAGYGQIIEFVQAVDPSLQKKVEYYQQMKPIFNKYDINDQLERIVKPEVELNCGGYLVIETTEALTAVDVNTGTYTEDNIEDTVSQANLEAAREIPRQLRLRNISGIIVIDFIGMDDEATKENVLSVLEAELKKDKTRTSLLGMTELGLVQITRRRRKNSTDQLLQSVCTQCAGNGKVLSKPALAWEVMDQIRTQLSEQSSPAVLVNLRPQLAVYLLKVGTENLLALEEEAEVKICFQVNSDLTRSVADIELKEEVVEPSFKPGDKMSVIVKDKLKETKGVAWKKGWLIEIDQAQNLVGQEVEVKVKANNGLISRAELITS